MFATPPSGTFGRRHLPPLAQLASTRRHRPEAGALTIGGEGPTPATINYRRPDADGPLRFPGCREHGLPPRGEVRHASCRACAGVRTGFVRLCHFLWARLSTSDRKTAQVCAAWVPCGTTWVPCGTAGWSARATTGRPVVYHRLVDMREVHCPAAGAVYSEGRQVVPEVHPAGYGG